jgi:hypothetical protein
VTFLPQLEGDCTFNVLVYADADSEVPMEWGDSDAKEIKNGEKVQLRLLGWELGLGIYCSGSSLTRLEMVYCGNCGVWYGMDR